MLPPTSANPTTSVNLLLKVHHSKTNPTTSVNLFLKVHHWKTNLLLLDRNLTSIVCKPSLGRSR
jgi:hypothetical protein